MPKNRFGKRKIPKTLEVNKGVTVKSINLQLKKLGFIMKFTGFEPAYDFPTYAVYPLGQITHAFPNNKWRVYALGDFTEEEWCKEILNRIGEYNKKWKVAAIERRSRKKMVRRKRIKALQKLLAEEDAD